MSATISTTFLKSLREELVRKRCGKLVSKIKTCACATDLATDCSTVFEACSDTSRRQRFFGVGGSGRSPLEFSSWEQSWENVLCCCNPAILARAATSTYCLQVFYGFLPQAIATSPRFQSMWPLQSVQFAICCVPGPPRRGHYTSFPKSFLNLGHLVNPFLKSFPRSSSNLH